jgi:hypothetical protein
MAQKNDRTRHDDRIVPNPMLSEVKVLGAVPAMVLRYALDEEQRLLAVLRYNRLIDVFTGTVCYSLQSHLRTFMPGIGEVDTEEIYLGLSRTGRQFVFPVQAGSAKDGVGTVQAEQDVAVCASKFPALTCRPIAAQFMEDNLIALFEFQMSGREMFVREEKHYRIVTDEDLMNGEFAGDRSLRMKA